MRILLFPAFFLFSLGLSAQNSDTLNYNPEFPGGVSKLAVHYFKIDFTREQRDLLNQNEIELIYSIEANGKAVLEKVNGVSDPAILDSLTQTTTKVSLFRPAYADGKPVSSMYFLALRFPSYGNRVATDFRYQRPAIDNMEDVVYGKSMDMLIGGVFNTFAGSAKDYLKAGGGMKIDMVFGGPKFGIGMNISFYGNGLKKPYPISSTRQQNSTPPTMLLGLVGHWVVLKEEKKQVTLQAEANMAMHNVTNRIDSYDKDYTQFSGFSPGILVNYAVKLGGDNLNAYHWNPTVVSHWINFHIGLRPLIYDQSAANGVMIELGVGYRMKSYSIKSYRLKD